MSNSSHAYRWLCSLYRGVLIRQREKRVGGIQSRRSYAVIPNNFESLEPRLLMSAGTYLPEGNQTETFCGHTSENPSASLCSLDTPAPSDRSDMAAAPDAAPISSAPSSGVVTLLLDHSYDFKTGTLGEISSGNLYLTQSQFWANNGGQRGVLDLGDLGTTDLSEVEIPSTGYTRFGVPVVLGNTYVALGQQGDEGNYVVFRVVDTGTNTVTLQYQYVPQSVTLFSSQSYDFSKRESGQVTGGDLYLTQSRFWADNVNQRGVLDLGDLGNKDLTEVEIPSTGYTRSGVPVVVGHTYVALGQQGEEGSYIVFRVTGSDVESVDLEYRYVPLSVTLSQGVSYDFSEKQFGETVDGDFFLLESRFFADSGDQRGVLDLGDLGQKDLTEIEIPSTGYVRTGVAAVMGHTYIALGQKGEEGHYIVFRVTDTDGGRVDLEYRYVPFSVMLSQGDSYDFSDRVFGRFKGGDFYLTQLHFWANNENQRGVLDLGDLGTQDLLEVEVPSTGYTRSGVKAVLGHTYVAFGQQGEEGNYIVFRVTGISTEKVQLEYRYVGFAVTLTEGQSYDFGEGQVGDLDSGDFHFTQAQFFSNNDGQRGIRDLGDLDESDLTEVGAPTGGFQAISGVKVVAGHTYVVGLRDGQEKKIFVFRVMSVGTSFVTLEFRSVTGLVTTIDVSSILEGGKGTVIDGLVPGDQSGGSVSSVGDLNGDGFDDVIIGAHAADPDGNDFAGQSYVVFGTADDFPPNIDLSLLNGMNGFVLNGIDPLDVSGRSVAAAGDINGDEIGDLIIGASQADAGGLDNAGAAYVVYGRTQFPDTVNLSQLDEDHGFVIRGSSAGAGLGRSVSGAGDFSGDGVDDVIIGASDIDEVYVVYGRKSVPGASIPFPSEFNVSSLNGFNGFTIRGTAGDETGFSVSDAGDVNGDGIGDVILGSPSFGDGGIYSVGRAHVIFGKRGVLPSLVSLNALNGTNGFSIGGFSLFASVGRSVTGVGDFNGDGLDDVAFGAPYADAGNLENVGKAYVVYGQTEPFTSLVPLASLDGTNGFAMLNLDRDQLGHSVSGAGDVNGDGFNDVVVSAPLANDKAGKSYLVYGHDQSSSSIVQLDLLDGANGLMINGIAPGDQLGASVSSAGDVNDDGFGDLILGAIFASPNDRTVAGQSYIIYGENFNMNPSVVIGTPGNDTIPGTEEEDVLVGGAGDDVLDGGGGADVLDGGVGDDVMIVGDPTFRSVDGGSGFDTLRLSAEGQGFNVFDLRSLFRGRITGVEGVDLAGASNTLVLNVGKTRDLSATSRQLFITGVEGSQAFITNVWDLQPETETFRDVEVRRFTNEADDVILIALAVRVSQFGPSLELAALDDAEGFEIRGASNITNPAPSADDGGFAAAPGMGDLVGSSVSWGGDIDGDGFDDVIVGAPGANGIVGQAYVLFGTAAGYPTGLDLSSLDGTDGFSIDGIDSIGEFGISVNSAGDVNGDNFQDLIVGARRAGSFGKSYIVFGRDRDQFAPVFDLSELLPSNGGDGTSGFVIDGIDAAGRLGTSVASAGDVNGDGMDDLIVGAYDADIVENGLIIAANAGKAYVVLGQADGFGGSVDLSALGGGGFVVTGGEDDRAGRSVASAGDVNGDGLDDVIVGAPSASGAGRAYVIYGRTDPSSLSGLDLSTIVANGDGFELLATDANAAGDLGHAVSSAGDVNGDKFDDIIIGAIAAQGEAVGSGVSYVVFGRSSDTIPINGQIDMSDLDPFGTEGFQIDGLNSADQLGYSVSSAGDINGDGFDDLLVGAYGAENLDFETDAGQTYLVYGAPAGTYMSADPMAMDPPPPRIELQPLVVNGTNGLVVDGVDAGDNSGFAVSAAGDVNGDGLDDLIIGARYAEADVGPADTGHSYVVFGQTSGVVLKVVTADGDLTGTSSDEILIGGSGSNELIGGGGADVLRGGAGNDILRVTDTTFVRAVGGTGQFDRLVLDGAGLHLNLTNGVGQPRNAGSQVQGLEQIDIRGTGSNEITLDVLDVLNVSKTSNTLKVIRDMDDTINLTDELAWTRIVGDASSGFQVYTQGAATLILSDFNTTVVTELIYYNNSSFDGDAAAANENDDDAIAPDKEAFELGDTAEFDNYTSYARGINGIMMDVEQLPASTMSLDAAVDFDFRVGNDSTPGDWTPVVSAPLDITIRRGEGEWNTDRITIVWPDNAIQNEWLQVTVRGTNSDPAVDTGLTDDHVFYFGNTIGESGDTGANAEVDVADVIGVRANASSLGMSTPIENHYDFNRDTRVDLFDLILARDNAASGVGALQLVTPVAPAPPAPAPQPSTVEVSTESIEQADVNHHHRVLASWNSAGTERWSLSDIFSQRSSYRLAHVLQASHALSLNDLAPTE